MLKDVIIFLVINFFFPWYLENLLLTCLVPKFWMQNLSSKQYILFTNDGEIIMFSSVMYMLHNVCLKHGPKFFFPHWYKNMFLTCSITKFGVTICAYNDNPIFEALACSKGLWILGGCVYSTPIFWSLPLHLEV
jgi:hypothetical protein